MRSAKLIAALVAALTLSAVVGVTSASALIGFRSVTNSIQEADGTPLNIAGYHPDVKTVIKFNLLELPNGEKKTDDTVRDVITELPAGFYGNSQSLPFCSAEQLLRNEGYCDTDAQVGVIYLELGQLGEESIFWEFPIFNMASSTNQTAVLSAVVLAIPVKLIVSVRTDGDYGLQIKVPSINQALPLAQLPIELWGVPEASSHDPKRCTFFFTNCGTPSTIPPTPFLTTPVRCGEPLVTEVKARSWEHPDYWATEKVTNEAQTGCDGLDFSPKLRARPTTSAADIPAGLDFNLHIPQSEDPEGVSSAQLRKAEVKLPEGFVINPSGANGLEACTPEQIHLTTPPGDPVPAFSKAEPECPDAARLGSVRVDTPLLADPLLGSVYAATPYDNPFNSLLAVYATFKGPGLNVKLTGKLTPDPVTGQLTATFDENPQLTFEDLKMTFFGGAFAPLRTPSTCGKYVTTSTLTPWSAPETPAKTPFDTWSISQSPGGKKACPTKPEQKPNVPTFEAGSTAALAGQYRPFVINLRRNDGSQEFSSVKVTPPPGLVAKLAGTAICPDSALAAAGAKSGAEEKASPSCPPGSEVGNIAAAVGAGPAPYNNTGNVYLAGPYRGAPLSLAAIVPAVAGPYDLGNVVVRAAIHLDPATAQITATTDPIPSILKGVPLDIRSLSLRLDKPEFALNPSSCDPSEVDGAVTTTLGATANVVNRFQLAECGRLKLTPKLRLSLKGGTKRGAHPALTAVLRPRPGNANLTSVRVTLPHSELLDQAHIGTVCTRVQWAVNACPADSIYGTVTAQTPLLDSPLTGNVYLRSSDNKLPDLVLDLHGPASQPIHIEAAGRTDAVRGALRNSFESVPDVPFSKLTLKLKGGRKGLLINNRNICRRTNRADVRYVAHNGLKTFEQPAVEARCKKGKKRK